MSARGRIGILGGTFDPIHLGHLDAAEAARTALDLRRVHLIPSSSPPHRSGRPQAPRFHRFALMALAVADHPGLRVSDMELERPGPSYTADTLRELHRGGWKPPQIFFVLGADAFAEIATWREFPDVLDGAHFVVIARPGTGLYEAAARTPAIGTRMLRGSSGLPDGGRTRIILVEARTRDVSSTLVRARLAAGQPVGDLVPDAVARHIVAHELYGAVDDLHGTP